MRETGRYSGQWPVRDRVSGRWTLRTPSQRTAGAGQSGAWKSEPRQPEPVSRAPCDGLPDLPVPVWLGDACEDTRRRGGARVPCRAHTRHRMHGPTRLPRGAPGKACRATRTYVRCAAAGTGPPPLLLFPLAAPADGAIGAPRLWPLSPPLLRPVVMMTASLERYGRLVSWEEWTEITPLPSFPWIPFLRPPFA